MIIMGEKVGEVRSIYRNAFPDDGVLSGFYYKRQTVAPEEPQVINYLMLYDEGDECTDVTGGWNNVNSNNGTYWSSAGYELTKGPDSIYGTCLKDVRKRSAVNSLILTDYIGAFCKYNVEIESSGKYAEACVRFAQNWSGTYGLGANDERKSLLFQLTLKSDGINGVTGKYTVMKKFSEMETDKDYPYVDGSPIYPVFIVDSNPTSGSQITAHFKNLLIYKTDNYQTLCAKAGVTAPADLDALISDTTSLTTIFSSEAAVNFMVKNCTGDFMISVLNNETARGFLAASPYLNTVIGNPHWAKFIMMIAPEILNYTMLYDAGDECTDITGGWDMSWSYGSSSNYGFTKYSDHIKVRGYYSSNSNWNGCACTNKNALSMSEYGSIALVFTKPTASDNNGDIKTFFDFPNSYTVKELTDDVLLKTSQKSINITNISEHADRVKYITLDAKSSGGTETIVNMYHLCALKPDPWQEWAAKANITDSNLETLLSDSAKVALLMNNREAAKYLMGCSGDLMVHILKNETAMSALVNSITYDYASNHPVWYKFMAMISA